MSDNFQYFAAGVAAAAKDFNAAAPPLYIADHSQTAAQLRRCLADKLQNAILPRVLPLPALSSAAAAVPLDSAAQILGSVVESSSRSFADAHCSLTMEIDAVLREQWPAQHAADILPAASALAELLAEFVDEHPMLLPPADALPQHCKKLPPALAPDAEIIDALWGLLKNGSMLAARRALHAFAHSAPPIVYVGDINRPLWLVDFLQQCKNGCTIYTADNTDIADQVNITDKTNWIVHKVQMDAADDVPTCADKIASVLRGDISAAEAKSALPQECRQGVSASLSMAAMTALNIARDYAADAQPVGVVVYDRLLARRLRAVAEHDGMLIEDDGGWRMETLSFGGALRQWAETVMHGFSAAAFGRLLRPPFWHGTARRETASGEWRKWILGDAPLPKSWAEAANGNTAAAQFAAELHQSHLKMPAALPIGKIAQKASSDDAPAAPLRAWLAWLLAESTIALAAWRQDAVAVPLRGALNMAAADGDAPLSAAAFLHWLGWFMERQTGGGRDVRSNVCFVTPATRRRFAGGLILLGAHAETLPSPPPHFFGEKRRVHFKLPGRGEWITRQLNQFSQLLAGHKRVAAVWHDSGNGGRPQLPSPFWTLLADALSDIKRAVQIINPPSDERIAVDVQPPKTASAIACRMPETLAITGLDNLMKCPYHFYAANILRLDEGDDDEYLNAAAQGRLLHRAMKHFAEDAVGKTELSALQQCWQDAFVKHSSGRQGARMAVLHWRQQGDKFLQDEWQWRMDGGRIVCAEEKVTETLETDLGEVRLRGKIDRLDSCPQKEGAANPTWQVVDYKSGGGGPSARSMQSGEAPQLPFYAVLSGHPDASWRLCNPAKGENRETIGNAPAIAEALREILRQIGGGASMPANGALVTCRGCASRRLCRRDHACDAQLQHEEEPVTVTVHAEANHGG